MEKALQGWLYKQRYSEAFMSADESGQKDLYKTLKLRKNAL